MWLTMHWQRQAEALPHHARGTSASPVSAPAAQACRRDEVFQTNMVACRMYLRQKSRPNHVKTVLYRERCSTKAQAVCDGIICLRVRKDRLSITPNETLRISKTAENGHVGKQSVVAGRGKARSPSKIFSGLQICQPADDWIAQSRLASCKSAAVLNAYGDNALIPQKQCPRRHIQSSWRTMQ